MESTITQKAQDNAGLAAMVVGIVALVYGIYLGIKKGYKWWYYLLLFLLLVPAIRIATAGTVLLFSKKD